jgi:hypothetical protein
MSNENNFNPDCAEDERNMRPTPEASDNAIPSDTQEAKTERTERNREDRRSTTISEAMQRSMKRIDDVFKESFIAVKNAHPDDSIAIRLMTFHRVSADTLEKMKPALLDIVMSQIHTSIMPLLSAEERAELDRVTLDDVLHDMAKQILG